MSREIGNGGEGYQDVAWVRDRAVGEHALDVGLHQGAEVAGEHGEHGEHPEGPEPEMRGCGNRGVDAQEEREGAGFRSRAEERAYRHGCALLDGRGPDLERG